MTANPGGATATSGGASLVITLRVARAHQWLRARKNDLALCSPRIDDSSGWRDIIRCDRTAFLVFPIRSRVVTRPNVFHGDRRSEPRFRRCMLVTRPARAAIEANAFARLNRSPFAENAVRAQRRV